MKKKLLSLLMAGAVVAGSTVPAFAQNQTVGGLDSAEVNANVTVTGTVHNLQGNAPAGRIEVEIPTALSFTVDNQGRLTAGSFNITNRSQGAIDVKVGSFQETKLPSSADPGITLHNDIVGFDRMDRSNVVLVLRHNATDVILEHGMSEEDLVTIDGGKTATVQVLGDAGKDVSQSANVDANGVTENFNLVFKITKH